jgi:hypothetical protein
VMHQQSLLNRLDNQWCKKVLWFSIENGHDRHSPVMDSRKSCIQKCRQKRKMVYVLTSFVTAPYMYEHPDGASVFQGYLAVACSPAQIAVPSPVFIPHFPITNTPKQDLRSYTSSKWFGDAWMWACFVMSATSGLEGRQMSYKP